MFPRMKIWCSASKLHGHFPHITLRGDRLILRHQRERLVIITRAITVLRWSEYASSDLCYVLEKYISYSFTLIDNATFVVLPLCNKVTILASLIFLHNTTYYLNRLCFRSKLSILAKYQKHLNAIQRPLLECRPIKGVF